MIFSTALLLTQAAWMFKKRYTSREIMGIMQPQIWLRFPGTCDIRYFWIKQLLTSRRPSLLQKNRVCAVEHT